MSDHIDEIINHLEKISPMPSDSEVTEELLIEYDGIVNLLAQFEDKRCIKPLIDSFGYGDGNGVYWGVVHLLERFPIDETGPILLTALHSKNPGTRMWSALMLGRSENELAIPGLFQLLNDTKELVRAEAILTLGRFHKENVKEQLLKLKKDPSQEVQAALKIALQ